MMFGIAKPMIINFSNTWFSLNLTRDKQYAAGAQTSMIKIHDGTVYITEFPRFSKALFFVNALMKLSKFTPFDNSFPVKISFVVENEARIIHPIMKNVKVTQMITIMAPMSRPRAKKYW